MSQLLSLKPTADIFKDYRKQGVQDESNSNDSEPSFSSGKISGGSRLRFVEGVNSLEMPHHFIDAFVPRRYPGRPSL